jgi:hypothetical protein
MDGRLTLAALAIAFLAWFGVLLTAWPTWEGMNHATGIVAACSDGVLHGEAPGLNRGEVFLGTPYFPPVPLLVAAAKQTGMSWRPALRWVNLFSMLALLAAVALCGQALGGGGVAMTVSLSILLVSFPFVRASLAGRADPLAAALSIGALAAWCYDPRRRGWWAPALAAAACLVKATSLAVPLAVMISAFGPGARRGAGPFAARFFAALAAGVVLTMPWNGPGWYADVLYTLALAPPNTGFFLRGPFELLRYLASFAELTVAAGLAIVFLTSEWSRGRPVRPFAVAALALAMLTMTNRGSDHNHLLELTALAAVAAGLWAEHATRREAALGLALVLLVVTGAAWRESRAVGRAAGAPEAKRGAVLAAVRAEPGPVLCEDPLVAVAAGRRAEISDASTVRSRLGKGDPRARAVVDRIASGRYALVVLNEDLEAGRNHWYRDFQFGAAATNAIADRYEKSGTADGFHLYRLRPATAGENPAER